MWIGVALGLLVVLGLLVLGVYFYMKQRALQSTKPPPYSRDRDGMIKTSYEISDI